MGYQMYDILENEKLKSSSDFISLLGLLYYRFTERISQHGVKVKLVIEWYENQVLDRGMIKGFHTFYPGIPVLWLPRLYYFKRFAFIHTA